MAYRNLTFRSLATNIRTESYLGEDHIVIPCIALVGDEVVYGMNAEGPEFIPADELEFSTLGWSGRPVLYDHPSNSTSTANEPATLQSMSFGQIFYPKFENNRLKVEAWCNKRRALEIGQDELITFIENGEVIELSVGAIISLDKTPGIAPNGKRFSARWYGIQSDHLAIGLSGSQGACNIEMGCGANRVLKVDNGDIDTQTNRDDARNMRANRGVDTMPEIRTSAKSKPALPALDIKPRSLKQRILSLASQAFRSLAEDEGLSDKELRDKLWDQLYAVEPAFYGIENVYQESATVTYITSPDKKLHMWRRSFTTADDGSVTINDDREEVAVTDFYYIYMGENPIATQAAISLSSADNRKPRAASEGISFESIRNWLNTELSKLEPGANWLYVEDIYESSVVYSVHFDNSPSRLYERSYTLEGEVVTISSDRVEVRRKAVEYEPVNVVRAEKDTRLNCGCQTATGGQTVSANEIDNVDNSDANVNPKEDTHMADPTKPDANATTPATTPVPTPEKGSSEVGTPSQNGSEDKTVPNYPAGVPNPDTATNLTEEQQIDKLPAPLRAMVKSYQDRDRREKESLVGALSKAQKAFTKAQLEAKPTDELRQLAELTGVGNHESQGDFSGRMMVAREGEMPPPPDPHGVNKYLKRGDSAN